MTTLAPTRRPRDARGDPRRRCSSAAAAVFDEVGYDRATTREIGERAGVDPALIARYFDCKEGLFLAAIAERGARTRSSSTSSRRRCSACLLERWDERGHSPISRALASPG